MQEQTEDFVQHGTHWILDLVEQRSSSRRFVWSLLLVIGVFDWMTGAELSFESFYLLPILLAGLSYGWSFSLQMAVCAVSIDVAEGLWGGHHFSQSFFFYFHVFSSLLSYAAFVIIVQLLRNALLMQMQMAETDALTGLLNRRALNKALDSEHARIRRSKTTLGILFIDCDNFKDINDRLGHPVGDRVLKAVADVLRMQLRDVDVLARFGGDEFVVLLPNSTDEGTLHVAEKLQAALLISMERQNWPITFSIGVHVDQGDEAGHADALLSRADMAMYEAKQGGKNRIMVI